MIPFDVTDAGVRLAVAGLGGLAVGIEREWSARASQRSPRFGGVRTFLLLGLSGGLGAELTLEGYMAAGLAVVAASAALVVAAYAASAWKVDVEGTTEVSAIVVLAAGFLAGSGRLGLAAGIFAITAFALVEKSRIHSLVYRIPPQTLTAAARFAVLALVVLPALPAGPYGPPPGFRPRELWALVLLFSGLSFSGFLALHAAGARRGYGIAGLLGGLVSSTLVTLNFARESRAAGAPVEALANGTIGACTVLFARTAFLVLLLEPAIGGPVIRLFAFPFLVGAVWVAIGMWRGGSSTTDAELPRNPLRLLAALQMAAAFQIVLFLVDWASARFGSSGTLASAALLGTTDVDALTFSMVKIGGKGISPALAARALTVGVLANTLLKLVIALVLGSARYRLRVASGLAALAVATAVMLRFS